MSSLFCRGDDGKLTLVEEEVSVSVKEQGNDAEDEQVMPLFGYQSQRPKALDLCLYQAGNLSSHQKPFRTGYRVKEGAFEDEDPVEEGGGGEPGGGGGGGGGGGTVPLAEVESCGWYAALEKLVNKITDGAVKESELTEPIVRHPFEITDARHRICIDLNFDAPLTIFDMENFLKSYKSTADGKPKDCICITIPKECLAGLYHNVFKFTDGQYHFMPTLVELRHWSTEGIGCPMRFVLESKKPKSEEWTTWTQAYGVSSLKSAPKDRHGFTLAPNERLNTEPKSLVCWRVDPLLERHARFHRWKAFSIETMQAFANACSDPRDQDFLNIPHNGKAACCVDNGLTYLVTNTLPYILYRLKDADVKDLPKLNSYCLENAVTPDAAGSFIRFPRVLANSLIAEVQNAMNGYKDLMSVSGGLRVRLSFVDSLAPAFLSDNMHNLKKDGSSPSVYNPRVSISLALRLHCIPVTAFPLGQIGKPPLKLGQGDVDVRRHGQDDAPVVASTNIQSQFQFGANYV